MDTLPPNLLMVMPELLFRYRARNWPETLSAEVVLRWEQFHHHRLRDADGGGSITVAEYHERIALLRGEREGDTDAQRILDEMEWWGKDLFATISQ